MSQDAQPQFVMVPVPAEQVTKVYAFLTELAAVGAASPVVSPAPTGEATLGEDGKLPVVEWTVEDFRRLMIEPLGSVQVVARVLDVLAEQPDTKVGYTALASHLGMEKKNLQGNLAAFTRAVHRHYGRRNWPMTWVEALTDEPGPKVEFFYTMSAAVAKRWLKAREEH
ncbi:hypothetical protein OH807_19745 [Kitasatospora sp. NBC_01560]|uniref:hypothetical protein n=1 Tax=Kitasatospora sp. NBC_01560 TaxID=2975965 RepID=UPI0038684493